MALTSVSIIRGFVRFAPCFNISPNAAVSPDKDSAMTNNPTPGEWRASPLYRKCQKVAKTRHGFEHFFRIFWGFSRISDLERTFPYYGDRNRPSKRDRIPESFCFFTKESRNRGNGDARRVEPRATRKRERRR